MSGEDQTLKGAFDKFDKVKPLKEQEEMKKKQATFYLPLDVIELIEEIKQGETFRLRDLKITKNSIVSDAIMLMAKELKYRK